MRVLRPERGIGFALVFFTAGRLDHLQAAAGVLAAVVVSGRGLSIANVRYWPTRVVQRCAS